VLASELQLGKVISPPFDENSYICHLTNRRDCLVFDPGFDPDSIHEYLEKRELTLAAILCTHGHSDHIAGNSLMKERWPRAQLVIGVGDASKLTDPQGNLSALFGVSLLSPPADRTVDEPDLFEAAGLQLEVLSTPGHSSGHVVFLCKQVEPWYVFGGDVLFRGSVGRTDFPDGDFDALRASIHDKLFTLPDDAIVLPGHGPATTIGREKQSNPFVGAPAGYVA
jgi:hydroxyacylglutathione hydrolase